ncbi:MAG: peptidylprolyl isomerase [Gammaproteobacteria bacterium]
MQHFLRSLAVLLVLLLPVDRALAQSRDLGGRGDLLDRIAAVVNEGIVLQSQVEEQMDAISRRLRDQGQQVPPSSVMRQQVLERLILQEIQVQRAGRLGIEVSDEMLNNALQNVARQNNIEFDRLPEVLAAEGIDYGAYRQQVRREMTLQFLRQRDVMARIYISPREIDQFITRQAGNVTANTEYEVAHILVSLPEAATPQQLEAAEQRARELHERAVRGEDFGQLALQYSQAQSALERGSLGWRKGSELPQFMADAVAGMKPGEIAAPIRTPSGFHIVRLGASRGGDQPLLVEQTHARHILVKPNELQDDATVRGKLADIRAKVLAGDDFAAIAAAVSEDPGSGKDGGDLGWASPGMFVPEFETEMGKLKDGEISEPFQSPYGWHIIQVLGRRTQDTSSEERRRQAIEQLRASKAEEETELWLRRLRDEAYVESRL